MDSIEQDDSAPVDWRTAVKETMHQATLHEALRRYGSETPSFNYRWEHVTVVVTLALKLAHLTGADPDIVEAAAWLHDVRKEEAKQNHPQAGAEFARQFLPTTNFPPDKIERVAQAIALHTGLWRGDPWPEDPLPDLESQVLWDADKLSKIGLTAAFHWTGNRLAKPRPSTLVEILANGRRQDWINKTVASMHTLPARRAAQNRCQTLHNLWDTLEEELAGSDLH